MEARDRRLERLRQPPFDHLRELERLEILNNEMADDGLRLDLVQAGYPDELDFPHLTAYINAVKPLPKKFVDIVLNWIPKLKFKEGALNYLRETKEKYDGRVLISIFNEGSKQVKWQVCDAIEYNPPLNIDNWVREIYLDNKYGYEETGLLPLALIKLLTENQAREVLKLGFDHHPGTTSLALGKIGNVEDISFLEGKLQSKFENKYTYKEIKKAISKIKTKYKLS